MPRHPEPIPKQVAKSADARHAERLANVPANHLRVQPVMHIADVLAELGAEPDRVIRDAGLEPSLFSDSENIISRSALEGLVRESVQATGCDHLGLRIGVTALSHPFGLLGDLLQHCSTVGTALAYFQQHFHLHDRIGVATRSVDGSHGALGYTLIEGSSAETDHIHDAAIAIAMTTMRLWVGPHWKPRAVTLPRRKPRNALPFVQVFGVLPQFEAEHPGLHFSASDFDRPVAGADPNRFALLIEKVRTVADAGDIDFVEQVRRALRGLIALRRCSADDLAGAFSMSRRHLNRKLAERGISYRQIHDEARWALAERLLLRTDKSLMEISVALDYADASAFSRAFKGWKGEAPSTWRKRAHAAMP